MGMRMRTLSRLVSMYFSVGAAGVAAASCGSSASSVFHDAGVDGAGYGAADGSLLPNDAAIGCATKTCAEWGFSCGMNSDGCGGVIDCGTCTGAEFCGGGGYSRCGTTPSRDASALAAVSCTPKTCEELGANCGWAGDGCGGVILCGSAPDGGGVTLASDAGAGASECPAPTICGGPGGVTPNRCSGDTTVLADGAVNNLECTPAGCSSGANCGVTGDGCGNVIPCGADCTNPQYCGGGGPNVCGGFDGIAADGGAASPPCTPTTCGALGYNCGYAGDGCGHLLDCSDGEACPAPGYCGGGGPNVCGGSVFVGADGGAVNLCSPRSCADQGFYCGEADDGCGNVLECGTCDAPDTCGGGGVAGQCGHVCTGLCPYQAACDGGTTTAIQGTVYAAVSMFLNPNAPTSVPNPPDPVPNVLVYVPNAPLAPIAQGYTIGQCPLCGADVSGSPLVSTYTNFDGTFTLTNVPTPPAGQQLPLVIQLGRWRKEFLFSPPPACETSNVGGLNLPSNKNDGAPPSQTNGVNTTNIPLTAISTGNVDALECVLLKMGIDESEFTADTGTGRIHLYSGGELPPAGAFGATTANADPETTLMNGTTGTYMNYDQLMFPCWGAAVTKTSDELASLIAYADSGGHFFATHYSYSWLYQNGEFNSVAVWNPDFTVPQNATWTLDVSTALPTPPAPMYSAIFYQWLNLVGALVDSNPGGAAPADPQVQISDPRHDANAVANGSLDWIDGTDPMKNDALVEHFTFNTPVSQPTQCGHAIFSDFHVANADSNGKNFPDECVPSALTAQERILEYMIFDLASCVTPPASACTPKTCAEQGLQCGPTGDGCGNPLDCGSCPSGLTCGGGGQFGVCGEPDGGACTPVTSCTGKCGVQGDGCGGTIACACPSGQTCGGGGVPNQCGVTEAGACQPRDCAAAGVACGAAGDGCGNPLDCGGCPAGQTCGGSGVHGQCGTPDASIVCAPLTCADQNIGCGMAGDGCGNPLDCGGCTAGQTCGGGGVPNQCGGSACAPYTCADFGYNCGPAGDGCGSIIQCGSCSGGNTCGGGGAPGVCGAPIVR
jgi:hypothetical protein